MLCRQASVFLNRFQSISHSIAALSSTANRVSTTQSDCLFKKRDGLGLVSYQQIAAYRRNFVQPPNWVKRRGGGFDQHLTPENKEFLDKLVIDQFSDATSPLKEAPWKRGQFDPVNSINKRVGVLAIKLGSIPQWTKNGHKFYTTLLQIVDNHVIDYVPPEALMEKANGFNNFKDRSKEGRLGMALVGALSSDPRLYTPQYLEVFKNCGLPPKRKLSKFFVSPNAAIQPGTPLSAAHFRVGDYVDVGANTIGFGFQGVMKRWGFKGGPRSHGATKFHRKRGTIGSGRDRRPIKGMKMAGRMGCKWRQLRGLKIWRINHKYNVLYVNGPSMPGPTHAYVRIVDSCLTPHRALINKDNHPPFPTYFVDDDTKQLPDEEFDKELHKPTDGTITFENFEVKKITKREGAKLAKIKG